MFWAVIFTFLALFSIFVLWPLIGGLASYLVALCAESFGGKGCAISGAIWLVVQGLWILWISFCIVQALRGFGVDIPLF